MLLALYALFFLSGAAGLIYESIWTRYLALLVGHSAYAQILVLTIFLGGMAVGSFLVGSLILRLYPVKETDEELAMETPATLPAGVPA